MKGNTLGHLACFVAYTIFGINIIVCKDLTTSQLLSPVALFCLRALGAGFLFWLISSFLPKEKVDRKDYLKIFMAAVLGFFLTQMTFLIAIPSITPMDCSIVTSLSPIYTMFIAYFALHEPITLRKAGGVALSFCGIVYLILNSATGADTSVQTSVWGLLLMIANSLCFSLYLGLFKPTICKYSVITFMKWIFLFSSLRALPLAVGELVRFDYSVPDNVYWTELAFLIICSTCITYFLIPFGQKRIRPTLVSMYSYVQPIVAIAVSICVGMDTLSWQKVLAAATVFGGVVLVTYSRSVSAKS